MAGASDASVIAIGKALRCDRMGAAIAGAAWSWDRATDQFLAAISEALEHEAEREPELA